jgi:hypothetical protein
MPTCGAVNVSGFHKKQQDFPPFDRQRNSHATGCQSYVPKTAKYRKSGRRRRRKRRRRRRRRRMRRRRRRRRKK